MKNGKVKVFALVSALLLAVCAFAVAACDFTFRTKELTKIEVDSSNVQKVYHPGDDFDENAVKRALVVTAYYDDDTHAKVNSSGFRVVPVNIDHLTTEETQTAGRDTVKVVYGEHESSYDVTITEVTSLRVDAGGLDKSSFRQDESHTSGEIDHDGLKVYMVYNDGSEELLPADKYTVTADLSKAGNAKATVTTIEEVPVFERDEKDVITGGVVYKRFTAEYDINVIAHNLTGIKFVGEPTTKNYYVGDPFDPKGIQVVGIYEGEGEKPIELSSVKFIADGLEGGVFTKDGEITVTATFGTFTTENSFTVTVDKIRVESISFNSEKSNLNNLKTDYYDDDTFSAAGLVIDVVYNDTRKNKSVEYDSEKTDLKVNAPTMSEGKPQVTVTYTDEYGTATTTYDINVTAVKITGMSVKGIKSFFVGDKFDPAGITATITYNKASLNADVANVPISDNRLTAAANNLDENGMLKVGSTVTVTFDDGKHTESVTENITVTPIAINEEGTLLTVPEKEGGYFVGDKFDITAIKLHVVYNHGDPKDVNGGDAGVEVTVKGLVDGKLTESGEISISVTYTDDNKLTVTKTATITVTAVKLTQITLDTTALNLDGTTFARDESTYDFTGLIIKAEHNNSQTTEITYKKGETQGVSFSYGDITDGNTRTVTVTYEEGTASATADFIIKVKAAKSINSFYSANMDGANIFDVFVKFVGYTEPEVKAATLNFGETSIAAAENSTIIDGHIHFFFNFGTAKLTVSEDPYDLTVTIGEDTYDVILDETDGADWDIKAVIGDCEINLKGTKGEKATLKVEDKPVVVEKSLTNFYSAEIHSTIYYVWMTPKNFSQEELNTAELKIGDLATTVKTNAVLASGNKTDFQFGFDFSKVTGLTAGKDYKLSVKIGDKTFDIICTGEIGSTSETTTVGAVRISLIKDGDGQICFRAEDANTKESFEVTVTGAEPGTGAGQYQLKVKDGDAVASGSKVEDGTVLVLTVIRKEGFTTSVKANGSPIDAQENGTFEITVTAKTTIEITFVSEAAPEDREITLTFIALYGSNDHMGFTISEADMKFFRDNRPTLKVNGVHHTAMTDGLGYEIPETGTRLNIFVQDGTQSEYTFEWFDSLDRRVAHATYKNETVVDDGSTPIQHIDSEGESVGIDGWSYYGVGGTVSVAKYFAEGDKAVITFNNTGKDWWAVQLYYNTDTVTRGKAYEISLKLNSTKAGDILFYADADNVIKTLVEGDNDIKFTFVIPTDAATRAIFRINMGVPNTPFGEATFTITNLEFTEAKPVADGTQEHPFSVDDVLAIGEKLASNEYYKVDGKDKEIYVEGYVVNPGKLEGSYLNGLTISVGSVAAISTDDNTILLYNYSIKKEDFPDWKEGDTPYRPGDKLLIKGYLQNYGGTTLEICRDSAGTNYPEICEWTLPEENAGEEMQEVLDRLVAAYRGAPLNKDGDFTPDVDMRHFITYKVDFSKGPNESEKDIISIDADKHTLHIAPGDTEVTVTLLITVTCGNTTKTDTIEIKVPVKSNIVEGSFTITSGSVKDFTTNYISYSWSAEDANQNTIGGNLYAYPSNIQFNNKSNPAAFIASNVATPSPILSIEITGASGTSKRSWKLLTSNKPYTETNKNPTFGTLIKVDSKDEFDVEANQTTTITVNEQDPNAYYFALVLVTTSGASQISSIKINYSGAPMSEEMKLKAQAEAALEGISFDSHTLSGDLTLPTEEGVTFNWTLVEETNTAKAVLNAAENTVTVTKQETETSFTLKVTATCGTYTTPEEEAKTFTFTVRSSTYQKQKITLILTAAALFGTADGYSQWGSGKKVEGNDITFNGSNCGLVSKKLQFKSNQGYMYNATAFPGRIVSITLSGVSGSFTLTVGTSPNTGCTASAKLESNVWTAGEEDSYTFFKIQGGANTPKVDKITIVYEG